MHDPHLCKEGGCLGCWPSIDDVASFQEQQRVEQLEDLGLNNHMQGDSANDQAGHRGGCAMSFAHETVVKCASHFMMQTVNVTDFGVHWVLLLVHPQRTRHDSHT